MVSEEALGKLKNIINHTRQNNRARNDSDLFVRETLREAKAGRIPDAIPVEQIEALAAEGWLQPLAKSKSEYPLNILEVATQRRNHRLILKLLRHPDEAMRVGAAENFQILFAMLDGYYDEASSMVNQILLMPTESSGVKYALMLDLGRSSRRGLPREISDTARRLINDVDQVVSYHALRLLAALYDVRDWRMVLDRMISLVGEDDEPSQYFLSAGVEYMQIIIQHEPAVVDWLKSLLETYPSEHMAIQTLYGWARKNPDVALQVGLISRQDYRSIKGE
ncbi:MAG TPA: hypothetical protein VMT34_11855 [Aggregatilineales bacterium]|nr:hypothetical protein [Aggregatilineales bacterium]